MESSKTRTSWRNDLRFSAADASSEIEEKSERLSAWMHANSYAGVLFSRSSNFSWITAGMGNSEIGWGRDIGAASILVLKNGRRYVIAPHSEIPRLMDEGLFALGFEAVETKWFTNEEQDFFDRARNEGTLASDAPRVGFATADVSPLRYQLTSSEIEKFRVVGRNASEAVTETILQIRPGMMEREIETLAATALLKRHLHPAVLLIGSDERVLRYRHALPSDEKAVEKYVMVNVCAKRWGLIASVTRLAHFGPLPEELRLRFAAAAGIYARFCRALQPAVAIAGLFKKSTRWYAEAGYPGEWEFHHQGGACGYAARDYLLRPDSPHTVMERQAFALNPTVRGAKAEDTFIVFKDRVETLTSSPDWPMITVNVNGVIEHAPDVLIV